MQTQIKKWGNSYGIRIPLHFMRELRLQPGSVIELKIEADRLVVDPLKYDLDEMLSRIIPESKYSLLLEDATCKGVEVW